MEVPTFDIILARWLNLILSGFLVVYSHVLARKMKSFYLGIPLIVWAAQNVIFYSIFLAYHYEIILMNLTVAMKFFSYWSTFSTTLAILTFISYIYYIQRSCWRGNGT